MAVGDKGQGTGGQTRASEVETPLLTSQNRHKSGPAFTVQLLDGTSSDVRVSQAKAVGQELFDSVCELLELAEKDYFCISYLDDAKTRFWLKLDKTISSQISKKRGPFYFEVKFYPKEPTIDLHFEQTRYLLFLQIRLDILSGKVPASFVTHQLLGSYAVQSDIGDYDIDEHGEGIGYIKDMPFAPNQTDELLEKIARLHVLHRGQSAPEAEKNYLDNAKLLAFYGVDFHYGIVNGRQDVEGEVSIGVSGHGLTVYRDSLAIYRWPWQKIIHFTYNRSGFAIKVRPVTTTAKAPVFKYKMKYTMAKRLWQAAVEHHAFFRLSKPLDPERAAFPKVGTKFRYSGRTQHQAVGVTGVDRPAPMIQRGGRPRFEARGPTGTVDTTVSGYSTDRKEDFFVDEQRSTTNTLTLSDRKKPPSSQQPGYNTTGGYSTGGYGTGGYGPGGQESVADTTRNSTVPIAGFDDDDRVALLSGSMVGYSKEKPSEDRGTTADTSTTSVTTTTITKTTTVNVVMTGNRNGAGADEDDEMLPPYQDDEMALLRRPPKDQTTTTTGATTTVEKSPSGGPSSRQSKTTSRTYTDSDGNVITEFTLERDDGVVEKRIEKRTLIEEEGDDTDHDKALMEAIKAVTDMNQDLSVEKIEIQTNAERV